MFNESKFKNWFKLAELTDTDDISSTILSYKILQYSVSYKNYKNGAYKNYYY